MIENLEVILLGAGLSKRMGTQKLMLPFANGTVIGTVLEHLRGAGFARINAVLSREVAASLAPYPTWLRVAINEAPERGQSSSLAIGLEMTTPESDFCIMLADLPLARAEDIAALASR
ncbi:MAG: NTP transferase domain-containing protein, partial [Cloacibacillus sp.]